MKSLSISKVRQQGSGLIEVLVVILVLGVGMLSMARMQNIMMRDGGSSNNRALAMQLAQSKLDELRSFKCPQFVTGTACVSSGGNDREYAGIVSGSDTVSTLGGVALNVGYARAWVVTNYYLCGPGLVALTSNCNATYPKLSDKPYPDYKGVVVTVTWTDANGSQSLSLGTVIYSTDSYSNADAAGGSGGPYSLPQVAYTPIGVPDVVPMNLGNNQQRETSKALPDVSSKGYSVATKFSSVNYNSSTKRSAQDEFATVSCTCEFGSDGNAFPASYYIYSNGTNLAVKYPAGTEASDGTVSGAGVVSKKRGTVPSITGDSQDPLCTACCRDHHDLHGPGDASSPTALYDPDRPSTDYETWGDHKHYYFVNESDPTQGLQAVTSGKYLESCRFLRVDGYFRLMQDWRLADVLTMPKDNYLTNSTNLANYQSFVSDVVANRVSADISGSYSTPLSKPSGRDLSNLSAGLVQLMVRGIYVDRVYKASTPRVLDDSYNSTGTGFLARIPFNEVNLTLLSSWQTSNPSVVTVTNETMLDINATASDYYGTYSRGRAQVIAGSTAASSTLTAWVLPSNSGLTGGTKRATYLNMSDYDASLASAGTIPYQSEIGIDRDDHRSGNRKSDAITLSRASSSSLFVSGVIHLGNAAGQLAPVGVTANGTNCNVSVTGTTASYNCAVTASTPTAIVVSSSQTNAVLDSQISGATATSVITCNKTVTSSSTCPDYYVFGPSIKLYGLCKGNDCDRAKVTAGGTVCPSTRVGGDYEFTCPVPVDTSTQTWGPTTLVGSISDRIDIESGTSSVSCPGTTSLTLSGTGLTDRTSSTQTFNMCAVKNPDRP
jgi:hypothetical protein